MLKKCLWLLLALSLALPLSALSMPCHCFTDKDFDPGQPAAADPYFLATSQNSLFATTYGLEKKTVVFAKQKPRTTSEGLWVAYWAAEKTGVAAKKLQRKRSRLGSWDAAITDLKIDRSALGNRFAELLSDGGDDAALSRYAVNDVLASHKIATAEELAALRETGADDAETILASLLAMKTSRPSGEFYGAVTNEGETWGTHLLKAEIDGTAMMEEIAKLLGIKAQ